ncbi:MAG: SDR family oxidoreductase [Armatimonadota bacterium]|nr:MAG: SDR family oxidoreductase [Armatimonadota bacterium]
MPVLDLFKLDGRVALVTGGNRGIGRAIAQALAEAGASIAVTSRDGARADKAATEIAESTGQKCLGLTLDVRDGRSVEAAIGRVMSRLGGLDILVNNAGINIRESITDLDDESWHDIIETNLAGAMRCSRIAARHMKEKGWGRIINIGSILSFIGIPQRAAYASSKAGLMGMTRAMALDLAPYGVTVNALCPGVFKTEINRPILNDPDYLKEFLKQIPLGAMGDPAQLMGAVVFLASEASSYVTGAALLVDGGWTVK